MKKTGISLAVVAAFIICTVWSTCWNTEDTSTNTCFTESAERTEDTDSIATLKKEKTEEKKVPHFVEGLLDSPEWRNIETIAQIGNQAYYCAIDDYRRTTIIYNDKKVLVEDPSLFIYRTSNKGEPLKFLCSIVGKSIIIDYNDSSSLAKLETLNYLSPSFRRFKKDHWMDTIHLNLYHFCVDFPDTSVAHANEINSWIVKNVTETTNEYDNPQLYNHKYKGRNNNPEALARFAANCFFDGIRHESAFEELPNRFHMILDLRARLLTKQFVTYQRTTHSYSGGAHGYFTERLISYDYINKQEIDWDYLFEPRHKKDIENLFIDCVCHDTKYAYIENVKDRDAVIRKFSLKDEEDNPTGEFSLPQPGLAQDGIVFSFQPYDISSFAAGTFHFTIPYEKVKNFLTHKGKQCIELISDTKQQIK